MLSLLSLCETVCAVINVCPITIKNVGHSVLVKDAASRPCEGNGVKSVV